MKRSYYIGIDISKKTLDASIFVEKMEEKRFPHLKVDNNKTGFKEILKWARKEKVNLKDCMFCMENTGHYGLDLCSFLERKGIEYCSICPLVMKRSMGISRDKNDKIDSARIATFAFEKAYKLKPSKLASEDILKLKQLQSERAIYVSERAKYKAYISDKCNKKDSTFKRMSLMVETLSRQIEAVEAEIQSVIQRNEDLKTSYDLITSVPGVGKVIAISTLTHTNNFQSFSNARQYACYAGVAPFARTSGTSIHGAATVSRMGDAQIKAELSQGAMSASRNDPEMSVYAARKREEGKHPGVILNAIKFKLIERMFAVIHRGTPYVLTHEYKTMKNTAEGCHSGGRRKVSQERVFAS